MTTTMKKTVFEVLAEHFGVEIGEKFDLIDVHGLRVHENFHFAKDGLKCDKGGRFPYCLTTLIEGDYMIEKRPILDEQEKDFLCQLIFMSCVEIKSVYLNVTGGNDYNYFVLEHEKTIFKFPVKVGRFAGMENMKSYTLAELEVEELEK